MFIKQVGCECEECGPSPCESDCGCLFYYGDTGTTDAYASFDVTGEFLTEQGVSWDVDIGGGASITVYADGVLVYSTGCQTDFFDSTVITIPAGTTTLAVQVSYCDEEPHSIEWAWLLECG